MNSEKQLSDTKHGKDEPFTNIMNDAKQEQMSAKKNTPKLKTSSILNIAGLMNLNNKPETPVTPSLGGALELSQKIAKPADMVMNSPQSKQSAQANFAVLKSATMGGRSMHSRLIKRASTILGLGMSQTKSDDSFNKASVELVKGETNSKPFETKYLQEGVGSKQYYDDVKYEIALGDLFKIEKTLYNDRNQKYCPIIIEILDEQLQQKGYYEEMYVLQVWDDEGSLIFQRSIQNSNMLGWNVSNSHLVYILEGSQELCVVDFDRQREYIITEYPASKDDCREGTIVQVDKEALFVCKNNMLRVYSLEHIFEISKDQKCPHKSSKNHVTQTMQEQRVSYNNIEKQDLSLPFFEYPINKKIGTLIRMDMPAETSQKDQFGVHISLETADRQVSACLLQFSAQLWRDVPADERVEVRELASTFQRPQVTVPDAAGNGGSPKSFAGDPIAKYRQVTLDSNGTVAGVALRQSGHVDFYWNRFLVDQQEGAHNFGRARTCIDARDERKGSEVTLSCPIKDEELAAMSIKDIAESMANFKFKDIEIDFDTIYLTTTQMLDSAKNDDDDADLYEEPRHLTFRVSLNKESKIGIQTAKFSPDYDHSQHPVIHNLIKEQVRLYSSFLQENTLLFISHSNIVSIYSMVRQKWEHKSFGKETSISDIFQHGPDEQDPTCFYIGLMLHVLNKPTILRFLKMEYGTTKCEIKSGGISIAKQAHEFKGKVISSTHDNTNGIGSFFIVEESKSSPNSLKVPAPLQKIANKKDKKQTQQEIDDLNSEVKLYGLCNFQVNEVTMVVPNDKSKTNETNLLKENLNITSKVTIVQSISKDLVLAISNTNMKRFVMLEVFRRIKDFRASPFAAFASAIHDKYLSKSEEIKSSTRINKNADKQPLFVARTVYSITSINQRPNDETLQDADNTQEVIDPNVFDLQQLFEDNEDLDLTNAFFVKYEKGKNKRVVLIIGDRIITFRQSKEEGGAQEIDKSHELQSTIKGCIVLDQAWVYSLESNDDQTQSGFYVYDLSKLINGQIVKFKLNNTIMGQCYKMDFSLHNQRMTLIEDYQKIGIVPLLHQNQINFFGMNDRSEYIIWREELHLFIAVDRDMRMYTWSKTTGKLLSFIDLQGAGHLKHFEMCQLSQNDELYKRNFFNEHQLLVSKYTEFTNIEEELLEYQKAYQLNEQEIFNVKKGLHKEMHKQEQKGKLIKEHSHHDHDHLETTRDTDKIKFMSVMDQNSSIDFRHFKVVKLNPANDFIDETISFIHPCFFEKNVKAVDYQRLIISKDLQTMIDLQDQSRIFLYKLELLEDFNENGVNCIWRFVKKINNFPIAMVRQTNPKCVFTPNLDKFLDYDSVAQEFIIRLFDQNGESNQRINIPRGILSDQNSLNKHLTEEELIAEVKKRFCFISSNQFRIISIEDNLDAIWEIVINKQEKTSSLKLMSLYCPIKDSFADESDFSYQGNHFFWDPEVYSTSETLMRIIQNVNKIRANVHHIMSIRGSSFDHSGELQTGDKIPKGMQNMLYEEMFKINYQPAQMDDQLDQFSCTLTFTYLNWCVIEQVLKDADLGFEEMDASQVMEVSYCLFPQFETALHKIATKEGLLNQFFQFAESNLEINDEQIEGYEVPIFKNFHGQTPVHIVISSNNNKCLSILLSSMMECSVDHHDRHIYDVMGDIVSSGLEIVGEYLDARMKGLKYLQVPMLKRGKLMDKEEPTISMAQLWEDIEELSNQFFAVDEENVEELDVTNKIVCFSGLFNNGEHGQNFIAALSESDDLTLFNRSSVKLLIDMKFDKIRSLTLYNLVLPYSFYLGLFLYWRTEIYDFKNTNQRFSTLNYILSGLMMLNSMQFLMHEVKQLAEAGLVDYFSSFWNYLDIIPYFFVTTMMVLYITQEQRGSYEPGLMAISSLLMWFKVLSFMRMYNETGYIIRMLQQVAWDIRIFMFILLITLLAFADAMYTISRSNDEGKEYFGSYLEALINAYLLALGDFSYGSFDESGNSELSWTVFFFATMLNCVVMLNLLIAIVSETFAEVLSNKDENSYREKAMIIAENGFLLNEFDKNLHSDPNEVVLITELKEQNRRDFLNKEKDGKNMQGGEEFQGMGRNFNQMQTMQGRGGGNADEVVDKAQLDKQIEGIVTEVTQMKDTYQEKMDQLSSEFAELQHTVKNWLESREKESVEEQIEAQKQNAEAQAKIQKDREELLELRQRFEMLEEDNKLNEERRQQDRDQMGLLKKLTNDTRFMLEEQKDKADESDDGGLLSGGKKKQRRDLYNKHFGRTYNKELI